MRTLKESVTGAIEPFRREKIIRSSLEAEVGIAADAVPEGRFSAAELAELFITADVSVASAETIEVTRTAHHKCGRCWRHLPEVTEDGALCDRCSEMLA